MTFDDFGRFIPKVDGTTFEFKEKFSSSVARELAAFANINGSKILLDVNDDDTVTGAQDSNGLRARFQGITDKCVQPVQVGAELLGRAFTVHVRENDLDILQCRDGTFRCQGAATQNLTRDEIRGSFPLEWLSSWNGSTPGSPFSRASTAAGLTHGSISLL